MGGHPRPGCRPAVARPAHGLARRAPARARPGLCRTRPHDHGRPARGEGFCVFNITAIGARYAQQVHGLERVLILDWDVHHGNGTQAIFYGDPSVYYCSVHSFGPLYPRTGRAEEKGAGSARGTTLNIPIAPGTRDRAYLESVRKAARTIRFEPQLVLVVAGFDAHAEDPLGELRLSESVYVPLTEWALELADRGAGGRVVSVMGGGYNPATVGGSTHIHLERLAN